MAESIRPIRRVVTGNNAEGKSCVIYDSAAPSVHANRFKKGTGMARVEPLGSRDIAQLESGHAAHATAEN